MTSAFVGPIDANRQPGYLRALVAGAWDALRAESPALPLELYRVAVGCLLVCRAVQSLAQSPRTLGSAAIWVFVVFASVLVAAGVRPRLAALVLLVAFAWMGRGVSSTHGIESYLTTSSAFWILCLPVGTRRMGTTDLVRKVFVVWTMAVIVFAALWDVAWGSLLPAGVVRALLGLLVAFLLLPANSVPRLAAAALFVLLLAGLFVRQGPSLGVLCLLAGGVLIWAPELGEMLGQSASLEPTRENRIDAGGVLATLALSLFFGSVLSESATPSRRCAAILNDAGLAADFRWPAQPGAHE